MTVSTILDKGSLKTGLEAGNDCLVDVTFSLFFTG